MTYPKQAFNSALQTKHRLSIFKMVPPRIELGPSPRQRDVLPLYYGTKSLQRDLNPRPLVYKTNALPLSYGGL